MGKKVIWKALDILMIDDSLEIKLLDNKTQIKTKCILMHEALLQLVRLSTKQQIKQIC